MAETETLTAETVYERPRRLHFEWVLPLFFRPGRTLKKIGEQSNSTWLTPLLILTLLALVLVFVSGPIKQNAVISGQTELPQDFQWWSQQQQQQYMSSRAAMSGPLFIYWLPAVGALLGVWLGWVILSAILHLSLTLAGSRSDMTGASNLVAWASLPLGIRYIVQIVSVLSRKQLVSAAGLSGFVTAEGTLAIVLIALLSLIDIYMIWQLVLIMVGSRYSSALTAGKAATTALVAFLIFLALSALPGVLSGQLSGLTFVRPFLY